MSRATPSAAITGEDAEFASTGWTSLANQMRTQVLKDFALFGTVALRSASSWCWSVLPVSFMALAAVGADYSMLFARSHS